MGCVVFFLQAKDGIRDLVRSRGLGNVYKRQAEDAAGNDNEASTSTDNTVTYDATAPDTTITGNPPNPSTSSSASFTFTGNDGGGVGGVTFECRVNAGLWIDCTSPQTYNGLSDGSYTFEVRAIDSLGNTDPTPAAYTWIIDTTGPTVTINQASGQAEPTSGRPIHFPGAFSAPVNGWPGVLPPTETNNASTPRLATVGRRFSQVDSLKAVSAL